MRVCVAGLGKTLQVIALITHLVESEQPGPFLIVCPASLLPHWASEFKRFSPGITVASYWGKMDARTAVWNKQVLRLTSRLSMHALVVVCETCEKCGSMYR